MASRAPAYAIPVSRDLPDDGCDKAPDEVGSLSMLLATLEEHLGHALHRATAIDNRILPTPMGADCEKLDKEPSNAALPTAERCVGLANRLHLVLGSLEQNVG